MSFGSDFLKRKHQRHRSDEAESAARRAEERAGEDVARSNAYFLTDNYLARSWEPLDRPDEREYSIDVLKRALHEKFVIKEEEIPASYWKNVRRIAREQGQGTDLEQMDWEELKRQTAEGLIADQRASLDAWVDYLASSDAPYPVWLKYFALRSALALGEYDKQQRTFTKRSKGSVEPYSDINREALAMVLDALEKKASGEQADASDEKFRTLLETENFAKLYGHAIERCTPASGEQLDETAGESR